MTPEFDCVPPYDRGVLYAQRVYRFLDPGERLDNVYHRACKEKYRNCLEDATGLHPRGVPIPERPIWS